MLECGGLAAPRSHGPLQVVWIDLGRRFVICPWAYRQACLSAERAFIARGWWIVPRAKPPSHNDLLRIGQEWFWNFPTVHWGNSALGYT